MQDSVVQFAIALLIGALIGIEREKTQRQAGDHGIAGLRTFILIAQAGAMSAWLARETGAPVVFAGLAVVVAAFIVSGYRAHMTKDPESVGLTTEFAMLTAFLLGGVALYGYPQLAVALAIVTSAVLAFRQVLHGVVERLGWDDIFAALKFLIVIFIVLPVVPRHAVDPWGVLNPYAMTWLVILIAGMSLLGYVVARWLGPGRGAIVTGLSGGLVSSTAVTLSMARGSRDAAAAHATPLFASGVLVSWAVMFVRVIVEAWVVNASLARALAVPMGVMAAMSAIGAAWVHRGANPSRVAEVPLKNPFSLSFAIKFALLFAFVAVLVDRAQALASVGAVYAVAALAGLTDVDAITLSMARATDHASPVIAVTAVTIAVLANTLVKLALVRWIGSRELFRRVLPAAIAVAAGAAVSLLFVAR